jgi:hypothetical protein
MFLSLSLAVVLGLIAGIHLYWAFGGFWPGADRVSLKSKVLGGPATAPSPSPGACVIVALALLFSGAIALQLGAVFNWLPIGLARLGGEAVGTVLFLRGSVGLFMDRFDFWQNSHEFNRLNRHFYSPLCLALALGFGLMLR